MAPEQARMMTGMSLVLVPVSVFATAWLPAALQFYFLVSAIGQFIQASVFHLPAFRRLVGLPELVRGGMRGPSPFSQVNNAIRYSAPRTIDTTATTADKTLLGDIKDSTALVKEKLENWNKKSQVQDIVRRAKEYEERRQMEEHEAQQARLELKRQKAKQRGRKI